MPVEILCRPIQGIAGLPGFKHCYFRITEGTKVTTFGLYPTRVVHPTRGDILVGKVSENDSRDAGGDVISCPTPPGQTDQDMINCVKYCARNYPKGEYRTRGPNSNTFVGHCARLCFGLTIRPPLGAIGWDDIPPHPV